MISKKQPVALHFLFLTELWERFSYYGMRALFVLYMVHGLGFTDEKAYAVYGAYGAMVYLTPLLGGAIADRLWGYRRAILFGGMLMALGQFMLMVQNQLYFYLGLTFLICGNGFLKPNISSLLGQFYEEHDPKRESGFTLFYVGVNIGGFLAPILCGIVGSHYGWHYGFGLAGVGMLFGLCTFLIGSKHYADHGLMPQGSWFHKKLNFNVSYGHAVYWFTVIIMMPFVYSMMLNLWAGWVLAVTAAVIGVVLLRMYLQSGDTERNRLLALFIFMLFAMVFWAFSEQIGSSLNLFTDRNIDRHVFGYEVPTAVFQSLNSGYIILFGPLLANLWTRMAHAKSEISAGHKFAMGTLQLGMGFLFFGIGAWSAANSGGMTTAWWLFIGVLLMTTGELCVEPIGIAMVTRLAPLKTIGLMMGFWYLMDGAFSNFIAGRIADLTSVTEGVTGKLNLVEAAILSGNMFVDVAVIASVVALVILATTPWLTQLMTEKS